MSVKRIALGTKILVLFLVGCKAEPDKEASQMLKQETIQDSVETAEVIPEIEKKEEEEFKLNEENSIEFFFEYQKGLKENKVKLTTSMGSFTVQLYDNVPSHKANFIYLTKQECR